MNAATYNARVAKLKSGDRWWADPGITAAAAALCGATQKSGCNEYGIFTHPAREVLARVSQSVASALLVPTPGGVWFSIGVFESNTGSSIGLPSVLGMAHDTREAARLDAIREALKKAQAHATQCAYVTAKNQATRLVDQLKDVLAKATNQPAHMPTTKHRTLPTASLSLHEQAHLVPEMPPDQYERFLADVKARGVLDPIELIPGTRTVVEGRTRLRAAIDAKLPAVPVVDAELRGDTPVMYMLRSALLRRQLTKSQAAALAVELEAEMAKAAKERQRKGASEGGFAAGKTRRGEQRSQVQEKVPEPTPAAAGQARDQAAAAAGVNPRYVSDAKRVKAEAPELFEQVKAGTVKLTEATKTVKGEPKEQPAKVDLHEICAMHELKPCPFCAAGPAYLRHDYSYVSCNQCAAQGPSAAPEAKARAAWNKRATR